MVADIVIVVAVFVVDGENSIRKKTRQEKARRGLEQ